MTTKVLKTVRMFWRELIQAIAEPRQQIVLLYLGPTAEGDTYFKELGKAHRKRKGVFPTVEVESVDDIIVFTPYDIQAL